MSFPILDMENRNMRLGPSNMGRCGNGRGVHFWGVTMHPLTVLHPIVAALLFYIPQNCGGTGHWTTAWSPRALDLIWLPCFQPISHGVAVQERPMDKALVSGKRFHPGDNSVHTQQPLPLPMLSPTPLPLLRHHFVHPWDRVACSGSHAPEL